MKNIIFFGATGNIELYLIDYLSKFLGNEYKIIAVGKSMQRCLE